MQEPASVYLRHGQTPFFRLRRAEPSAPDAAAVVLGVPTDAGTTYQPGARLAPYHVRRVSALVQGYHPQLAVDVFATLPAVDGGNVVFPPFDRAAMRDAVRAEVGCIVDAGALPVLVGGDHSVTLPALRAVAARRGPLAVVHLDAHLDTSGPEVWGDDHHHGTPLRHAIEEGLTADGGVMHVGIRGPRGSADDDALTRGRGNRIISADEVGERGASRVVAELRERVGKRPVYVSIDVDAIDPAFAPGTGTPVAGGLTAREALAIVRGLAGLDIAGLDVVEVCPPLDHADITSHLAAALLFEGMAAAACRRREVAGP
jgi:agmatinase